MFKELKYFFLTLIIFFYFFFIIKYYISDENKKLSFRSINEIDDKIKLNEDNLIILKNDTKNIIEYVEKDLNPKKKKYFFLELLNNEN